jgi:hypothetical protein
MPTAAQQAFSRAVIARQGGRSSPGVAFASMGAPGDPQFSSLGAGGFGLRTPGGFITLGDYTRMSPAQQQALLANLPPPEPIEPQYRTGTPGVYASRSPIGMASAGRGIG